MGKRKTKTTQVNRPVYSAEIEGANRNLQNAYTASQPGINQVSSGLGQVSSDILGAMQTDGNALSSANRFLVGQLEGGPAQNPYLDSLLDTSNNRVMNQMRAQLRTRGLTGGSDEQGIIARALAENETGVRYNDYNQAMQRRLQAAGMSALPATAAAQLGTQGAMLPLQAGALQAAGTGGLLGQYQDVRGTQTQSGGLLGSILSGAAQGGMMMLCDARVKENIQWVGLTPAGVPLYQFDYICGERGVIGPMAQEVAVLQPDALGPVLGGYMTVDMGKLQ